MQYKVIINSVSYNKKKVKQLLIRELHCSEEEAFKYVSVSPIEVADYSTSEEAEQLRDKLQELGVYVTIQDETIANKTTQDHSVSNISTQSNTRFDSMTNNVDESPLSIGVILTCIGVFTWVIGAIGALVGFSTIGIMYGIVILVASIISGSIIYGLGEIVVTLHSINKKLK